jgi:hypothetical protein
MEFLVVVKSLRVIYVGFQAIARPLEAPTASTEMDLLFFQRRDIKTFRLSLLLLVSWIMSIVGLSCSNFLSYHYVLAGIVDSSDIPGDDFH